MAESDKTVCKKCILHSRVPNVTIQENGYCSLCNELITENRYTKKMSKFLTKKMEDLFEKVREGNYQYDVLVLFSGGKDSSYLLYLLKNVYKLNPLALSIINPVVNERARINMEKFAEKLNVELIKYQLNTGHYKQFMRFALLNQEQFGLGEFVGCRCCEYFHFLIGFKLAVQMKIPILADGNSKGQSLNVFNGSDFVRDAISTNKPIWEKAQVMYEAFSNQKLGDWVSEQKIRKDEIFFNHISPFTFMDYYEKDAYQTIVDLGFQLDEYHNSKTNCKLVALFDYVNLIKYDCTTYYKNWAQQLRDDFFEIDPKESIKQISRIGLEKERIYRLNYIQDYKKLFEYLVSNHITSENFNDNHLKDLRGIIADTKRTLDSDDLNFHFNNAIYINELADFLEMNLNDIKPSL